jgi:hypothetical protein
LKRIGMIETVAPVRQRQIVVDADEVDIGVRPERVEVEIDVATAVLRMVAEVFRPVGGIPGLARPTSWRISRLLKPKVISAEAR